MSRFSEMFDKVTPMLSRYLEDESNSRHSLYSTPESLSEKLDLKLGKGYADYDKVISSLEEIIKHTPKTGSRVFFNQLFGGKDIASMIGEMSAMALNSSMYTYKVAGSQILVEMEVVRRFLEVSGFDEGEGTIVPGGSISNLVCMLAAINKANPNHRNEGHDGKKYIAYTSEECHYSVKKNMGILGLGRKNLRKVKADTEGRMLATELVRMVLEDKSKGFIPFLVVATSGTTVRGAFDDLTSIHDVTSKHGLWLHVDGAYGGSFLFVESMKKYFAGLENADSFTWDPHKILGVPLLASAALFREKGWLKRIFNEAADYLFQTDADVYNPGNNSLQCGRKNDALKIWTAWKYFGDDGYADMIGKLLGLAQYMEQHVIADESMELVLDRESLNVCFNYKGVDAKALCERLYKEGNAMIGYGSVGEKVFIRFVVLNPDLGNDDIDHLVDVIKATGNEMINESRG
ncbi:MAG: pyridoxal-dependent decarboxylase [Candidatus Kapaibacteriales bacterium]